jgi:hypothetical protein
VHHCALRRRIAFELGEVDVQMRQRAVAYLCSRVPYRFEVIELGNAIGAAFDEVRLELGERSLQIAIRELCTRRLRSPSFARAVSLNR